MVQIIARRKESAHLSNEQVQILADSLLHEMERHNRALDLVTDEHARGAIVDARKKVHEVFSKVIEFLEDPEIDNN